MKSILWLEWLICLIVLSHASKESYENLDQLLDDPNIWQYIEKRVGSKNNDQTIGDEDNANGNDQADPPSNSIPSHKFRADNPQMQENPPELTDSNKHDTVPYGLKTLSDSSGSSCTYRLNSSMIIRSKSSLDNGAAYLKNAFNLSAKECAEKCCYTQNCNLAVYEDKEEHSCYLFDCGTPSRCLFAHHGNYTIMSFQNNNYEPAIHQKYHENELDSLGKTPNPPTVAPPTTKAPAPETPTPFPQYDKVPLYGDCDIDWGQQCGDRNAECRDEQCKCKEGYHAIYAYCRKICSDNEFQCKNKGQGSNVPDCISSKHRCDGVPQCADGSDEENCPTKDEDNKDSDVDANKDTVKTGEKHGKKLNTQAPANPAVKNSGKSKEIETDLTVDKDENQDKSDIGSDKTDKSDIGSDKTDKSDIGSDKTDKSDKKETVQKTANEPDTTTKSTTTVAAMTKAPTTITTTGKTADLKEPQKVVIDSPSDSNQGPIVALALGLGICLMLLIFVGCRLRTVKRRIRRGKSLHSNEADYLINGMYL